MMADSRNRKPSERPAPLTPAPPMVNIGTPEAPNMVPKLAMPQKPGAFSSAQERNNYEVGVANYLSQEMGFTKRFDYQPVSSYMGRNVDTHPNVMLMIQELNFLKDQRQATTEGLLKNQLAQQNLLFESGLAAQSLKGMGLSAGSLVLPQLGNTFIQEMTRKNASLQMNENNNATTLYNAEEDRKQKAGVLSAQIKNQLAQSDYWGNKALNIAEQTSWISPLNQSRINANNANIQVLSARADSLNANAEQTRTETGMLGTTALTPLAPLGKKRTPYNIATGRPPSGKVLTQQKILNGMALLAQQPGPEGERARAFLAKQQKGGGASVQAAQTLKPLTPFNLNKFTKVNVPQ